MLRAVFVLGILAGCDVGEVPIGGGGPDGGGDTGAASFQQMVAPLVTECFMTNACHAVQNPILNDYASLLPKYKMKPGATNILVTKATEGTPHNGTQLSTAEQGTVAAWIDSLP